jgi:hypothetical protein
MSGSMPMFPTFTHNTWTATSPVAVYIDHEDGEAAMDNAICGPVAKSVSLLRLWGLLDESGSDDFGRLAPIGSVFRTVYNLVEDTEKLLGRELPSAPVVDSRGGIRITWHHGDKQVKLVWPAAPDAPAYIYQAAPGGNSVQNQNITAATLANKLSWLISDEPAPARLAAG